VPACLRADATQVVVIDGKGHLFGRLASIVAKQLLVGQKVVIVRCEGIEISGSLIRNKLKYMRYLDKKMRTNPSRGPYHYRSPARMIYRAIRGMIPHKTPRGEAALERLKVFDGVPPPYDKKKKMVVPAALRIVRLRPGRRFCNLGRLAAEVGWKYQTIVQTLEDKRKAKGAVYYQRKKLLAKLKTQAAENKKAALAPITQGLASYGF